MVETSNQNLLASHKIQAILALAFIYIVSGKLALILALPPGYATAIFPSAGIAMAAVVVGGTGMLPGVALGSFILNLMQGAQSPAGLQLASFFAAAAIAAGSSLQAWAGASAIRRWLRPALDSGRDVLLFLLLATLTCLISCSFALAMLIISGVMPINALPSNWLTWWIGDTIGVLIGAPLTWVAIGQPRRLWWRRRWILSLPLCVSSMAFILIYITTSKWEADQQMLAFRLKSQQVGEMLQSQFSEHERIIYTLSSLFHQHHEVSPTEFRNLARSYLDHRPELRSMFWMTRVQKADRASFERWASQQLGTNFFLTKIDGSLQLTAADEQPLYYPIMYIEPTVGNEHAYGVDMLAEPKRGAALRQAETSGRPSATEPVILLHKDGSKKGILLMQAVQNASGNTQSPPIGMLAVALQIEPYLERTLTQAKFAEAMTRLEDITDPQLPKPIVDTLGRERQAADFERRLELGGRTYRITFGPTASYLAGNRGWQSWSALAGGLMLTGLLGAFLLLMSGQRLQMERLVIDRTRKLQEREAKLSAILDNAVDAILTVDRNGQVVSVNSAAVNLFGYPLNTMHGIAFDQLVQVDAAGSGLALLDRLNQRNKVDEALTGRYANGQTFPLSVAVSLVEVTNETFFVCILRDLTEQQRSQQQIYQLAHHDPLTGLANRFTLSVRLEELLAQARLHQQALALLFIDLDYFKKINDAQGHHIGDQLLIEAGKRLQACLPDSTLIARLGNDEFIIVLTNDVDPDLIAALARDIISQLREPYQIDGQRLQSGASVGVSRFPEDGDDADTLLRNADAAVLAAKQQGRGKVQFFTAELNAAAQERLQMENRIWLALERKEFELYLQPQIHLASRRIIGAEALLRWRHPELGFIPPDRFIPIAEESGLILPLGEWVLERGLRILAQWQREQRPALRLAINLSARQCHSGTLIECLDRLVAETRVDLQWLEMEITETAAMQDPEQTRSLLQQLRQRGIKVAIDDFGTGYSSLNYLKLFQIDRIKIDRSFVKDIENDQNDAVIASATIALAHTLGLEVLAEGVETEAQCAFLNHELCDEGQGYLFGKPMPVADFEALTAVQAAPQSVRYA